MTAYEIIKKPVVTERSMGQSAEGKYTFIVEKSANKLAIKAAIEEIFGVKVESVNTMNYLGKMKTQGRNSGRRASFKKAIVKLTEESKAIEFFEGMA